MPRNPDGQVHPMTWLWLDKHSSILDTYRHTRVGAKVLSSSNDLDPAPSLYVALV